MSKENQNCIGCQYKEECDERIVFGCVYEIDEQIFDDCEDD